MSVNLAYKYLLYTVRIFKIPYKSYNMAPPTLLHLRRKRYELISPLKIYRALTAVLGTTRVGVTGVWRKLRIEELHEILRL
jgi:hypothetical protein